MGKRSRSDGDSRYYIVYPPEHSPSYGYELPRSFYARPAGQMTLEHDDPYFVTYGRGFKTSSGPYWTYKSGWPYNGDFGRNTAFTRQEFFNTMRQTHGGGGLNLRSMSSSSPNFVKRVN
jgi:hypothetical protein